MTQPGFLGQKETPLDIRLWRRDDVAPQPLASLSGYAHRCMVSLALSELIPGGASSPETADPSGLIFLAFSAGCLGALSAALHYHYYGQQKVLAFIALDGWGVPLVTPFPVHRLSHDAFTHGSSQALGTGQWNFYADPPVPHRQLWQCPSQVRGYGIGLTQAEDATARVAGDSLTAATFLNQCLLQAMKVAAKT